MSSACGGCAGVGKTTLVRKVCSSLKETNTPVQGFYTEEVRSGGRRVGFDVVTLCGTRGPLARVEYVPCMPLVFTVVPFFYLTLHTKWSEQDYGSLSGFLYIEL